MSGYTVSRSNRRTSSFRRALFGRAALIASMSCLALGLTVTEPLAAARPHAGQAAHAGHARRDRSEHERRERPTTTLTSHTYFSSAPIIINDAVPASVYPSTITVSNARAGRVTDVNVFLRGLTHVYADDIDIMLMAPDGRSTILMSDVGDASSPAGVMLQIDDDALTMLPDAGPLSTGPFKPANYGGAESFPSVSSPPTSARLGHLNGGNPNGDWRLYLVDDEAGYSGEITDGWALQLTVEREDTHHRRRRH